MENPKNKLTKKEIYEIEETCLRLEKLCVDIDECMLETYLTKEVKGYVYVGDLNICQKMAITMNMKHLIKMIRSQVN